MSDIELDVGLNAKDVIKSFNKLESSINGFSKNVQADFKKSSAAFDVFKGAIGASAVIAGVRALSSAFVGLGRESLNAASDAEETASKFGVVFSSISSDAEKTADDLAKNFGLASSESKKLLSDTGDLLTGFGFSQKGALDLSKQVQELAVDLASFTNFSGGAAGASQALTKALLGERESVKSLGISILETDVKRQVALNTSKGIEFATNREAKAYATLQLAVKQSGNAIGDFARTSQQLANQQRILDANLKTTSENFGKGLIPAFTAAAQAANQFLLENQDLVKSLGLIAGDLVGKGLTLIKDGFLATVEAAKQSAEFIKRNADTLETVGQIIAVSVGAFLALKVAILSIAAPAAAAALGTTVLGAAMTALPFVAVATGIVLLVKNFDAIRIGLLEAAAGFAEFTARGLRSLNPLEEGFRLVSSSIIAIWASTAGAIIQSAIDLGSKFASIFGIELPDSVTNFKENLLDLAVEIRNGGGVVDGLAKKSEDFAARTRLSAEEIRKETEAVKENNKVKDEASVKKEEERAPVAPPAPVEEEVSSKEVDRKKRELEEIAKLEEEDALRKSELKIIQDEERSIEDEERITQLQEQMTREEAVRAFAREKALENQKGSENKAKIERLKNQKAITAGQIKQESMRTDFVELGFDQQVAAASKTTGLLAQATAQSGSLGKKAAIADATIKGFQAVQTALTAPFPLNIVNAALVGSLTAQNISKIKSTPAFAEGGIVPGNSFSGDNVAARVNSGEMILNRADQSSLFNSIKGGETGGGGSTVNISGNVIADDDSAVDRLIEKIRDAQEFRNTSITPDF